MPPQLSQSSSAIANAGYAHDGSGVSACIPSGILDRAWPVAVDNDAHFHADLPRAERPPALACDIPGRLDLARCQRHQRRCGLDSRLDSTFVTRIVGGSGRADALDPAGARMA